MARSIPAERPLGGLGLLALASLALLGGAAGCETRCTQLARRARACGAPPQRYVDARDSVCQRTRHDVGPERFDPYAECVLATPCEDVGGPERCAAEHLGDLAGDACTRLRLWSSACGLEPLGTDDACRGIATTAGSVGLATYVDCVTEGGCPTVGDPRWERCQNLLPPPVQQLVTNCEAIFAWTTRCQGQGPSIFPIVPTPVPQCVLEAERFTIDSHTRYAACLAEVDCPDLPARLDCLLELRFLQSPDIEAQCARLLAKGDACDDSGGGPGLDLGQQACARLFLRFTPESFDAYIDCVEAADCAQDAATACAPALVVR